MFRFKQRIIEDDIFRIYHGRRRGHTVDETLVTQVMIRNITDDN